MQVCGVCKANFRAVRCAPSLKFVGRVPYPDLPTRWSSGRKRIRVFEPENATGRDRPRAKLSVRLYLEGRCQAQMEHIFFCTIPVSIAFIEFPKVALQGFGIASVQHQTPVPEVENGRVLGV